MHRGSCIGPFLRRAGSANSVYAKTDDQSRCSGSESSECDCSCPPAPKLRIVFTEMRKTYALRKKECHYSSSTLLCPQIRCKTQSKQHKKQYSTKHETTLYTQTQQHTCRGTRKLVIVASTCPTAANAPMARQARFPSSPLPKNSNAVPQTASSSVEGRRGRMFVLHVLHVFV